MSTARVSNKRKSVSVTEPEALRPYWEPSEKRAKNELARMPVDTIISSLRQKYRQIGTKTIPLTGSFTHQPFYILTIVFSQSQYYSTALTNMRAKEYGGQGRPVARTLLFLRRMLVRRRIGLDRIDA
jgi:hypothetical protein